MFTVRSIINKLVEYNQNNISENGSTRNSKICPFIKAVEKLTKIVRINFIEFKTNKNLVTIRRVLILEQ